jgi:hypothetical protein
LTFDMHTCDYCGEIKQDIKRMTIEYFDKYKVKRYFFSDVPLIIEHDYLDFKSEVEGKGWICIPCLAKIQDGIFNN